MARDYHLLGSPGSRSRSIMVSDEVRDPIIEAGNPYISDEKIVRYRRVIGTGNMVRNNRPGIQEKTKGPRSWGPLLA